MNLEGFNRIDAVVVLPERILVPGTMIYLAIPVFFCSHQPEYT